MRQAFRLQEVPLGLELCGGGGMLGIRVVSKYKKGGSVHAETFAAYDAKERTWRKEGVVSIRGQDGSEQARAYSCRGYEAGFHRHFDVKGELVAMVDSPHRSTSGSW